MDRISKLYWLTVLAIVITLLLPCTACSMANDVPRHSTEEVVAIARSFSPDCKLQVGEERHG